MVTKWEVDGHHKDDVGSWKLEVPCTSDEASASSKELARIAKRAFEALEGFFAPDWLTIHIGEIDDVKRDAITSVSQLTQYGEGDKIIRASTSGFAPEDIENILMDVYAQPREHSCIITDLQVFGATQILDQNDQRELTEVWEQRPIPADFEGLTSVSFMNRFPLDFLLWLRTYSRMYYITLCDRRDGWVIDNTEIAERNRERLTQSLRKLEESVGGEIVFWISDYLNTDKELYRYGFKKRSE